MLENNDKPVALVVDDEPLVAMLVSAILAARGWRVIRAWNGIHALALVDGIDIDLLVTDFDMPGMDGEALTQRLCERNASLPVLVVSGEPEASSWVEETRHAFLAKPFAIHDLALRIESLTGYATTWSGRQSN
jgi:DNA-binding response OmpR family regulator